MTTTELVRAFTVGAALALAGTGSAQPTPVPLVHECSADGLAQFECGNTQAIPDCHVTCLGKASCIDAQCDTIYVEGPLGPTDEVVAQFYTGPMCACLGGWQRLDSVRDVSCLAELFRRTDAHRSKVAKALTKCEVGVLTGRVALPSDGRCATDDQRTADAIAGSRRQAELTIARKCPAGVLSEIYGSDGIDSGATFVGGLLDRAEEHAETGIGLAVRPAVVAP
jgi:hypothetical protein